MQRAYKYDTCVICDAANEHYASSLQICGTCGHMTEMFVPDAERITSDSYMDLYRRSKDLEHEMAKMPVRWSFVEKHAPEATSLLDYGCGLNLFVERKPEEIVHYTDIQSFDVNWKSGFSDERILDREYDVVTAWHTLEHLPDPWAWQKRIKHKYLFLIFPWIEYVNESELASWPYFEHGMHLQFFTRKSIELFLKDYDILEENYIDGEMTNPEHPEWIVSFACKRKDGIKLTRV